MKNMLTKLRNDFFTGIIVVLPIYFTYQILKFLVLSVNSLILEPITKFLKPYLLESYIVIFVKFIAFLYVILLITLLGMATKFILFRRSMLALEKIISKVPMINKIYSTTKEMSQVFLGKGTGGFTKVVAVEYPRKGVYSIGFITSQKDWKDELGKLDTFSSVFVPTTPNPTSGMFILVPKSEIINLDISVAHGLKLIISGGAAQIVPPQNQKDVNTDV